MFTSHRSQRARIGYAPAVAVGPLTVLVVALTACGTDESTTGQASPSTPAWSVTSSTLTPASFVTAEETADVGACFDGNCTLTLSEPTTIPVDAAVFGFPEVVVSMIAEDAVTWESSGPGYFLRGTAGQGSTTTLSTGASTPITMRPLSFHDDTATIEIFPGKP